MNATTLQHQDIAPYLVNLTERERTVIEKRLAGQTYKAIATEHGVTREVIRALEAKAVRKLRWAIRKEAL